MLFKRQKIETANLERGMFVAQLDRPWLETPFLFQGFEIREDSELKLLRKFCKHVYIDVTRSSLPKEKVLQALRPRNHEAVMNGHATAHNRSHAEPSTLAGRLMRAVTRLDPTGALAARVDGHREYRNQVSTAREAPQAIRAYDAAVATMNEVLVHIRKGAGVDVEKVQTAVKPMIDSVLRNQDAMAWLVYLRKRDEYAYHHSIASSVWAVILGRHLGFDRQGLDTLAMGGMLLDIGKAKLPESLVSREGKLSAGEFDAVRKHVGYGLDMVKLTPGINADVLAMIEGHHERADGSGYPRGLKGADIPVFARIGGLVDCYDAMTSHRPWAAAKSPYDAIRELNTLSGVQFQKEMVEQFVQAMGMFPTGSVVEMNTGEVGIVVEQNRIRRLRPKVLLVLDADKQPLREFRSLDLRQCPSDPSERNASWIVCGHETGAFGLDPKNYFIG
ncbi:MAG: HD-GYP domain-containing protein [Gammaproteobacteria bacterium]|nr:HD-GYP domain-containing protein [Gammaproteobacteria bacterium]